MSESTRVSVNGIEMALRRGRQRRARLRAGARLHRLSRRLRRPAPGAGGARSHARARPARARRLRPTPAIATTYNLAQLADDLLGFVDALGLDRFDLLGHSMGGMVAQRFTLANPDRVASLVLMDTASAPLGEGHAARDVREGCRDRARDRHGGAPRDHPQRRRPERAAHRSRIAASNRNGAPIATGRACARGFTSMDVEAFEALGIELGDGGADDAAARRDPLSDDGVGRRRWTRRSSRRRSMMHEAIRGSQLVVIPDGGHSPQLEAPGSVARRDRGTPAAGARNLRTS